MSVPKNMPCGFMMVSLKASVVSLSKWCFSTVCLSGVKVYKPLSYLYPTRMVLPGDVPSTMSMIWWSRCMFCCCVVSVAYSWKKMSAVVVTSCSLQGSSKVDR